MDKKIISKILFLLILILFISTRLYMHDYLNDWVDYDGACYYLDAKHLLEGYVPYKDFILVHPLPFILFLAFFIKFFNLSFMDMFYLVYVLNFLGLIVIYKIGKLLRDEYFGVFLAFIYTIDPIILTFGKRLFMESLLIPLILLSFYYMLKYVIEKKKKYAYLSFLVCGVAFAIKMTMLFMFVGLVVFLFLVENNLLDKFYQYLSNFSKIFKKSLIILLMILTLLEILNIIIAKNVFIPFFNFVNCYNIPIVLLFIYILFTVSIITFKKINKKINTNEKIKFPKTLIICIVIGLTPKILEFILSLIIFGNDYINQYIIQQSRGDLKIFPIFDILACIFYGIYYGKIYGIFSLINILIVTMFILLLKNKNKYSLSERYILLLSAITIFFYGIYNIPGLRYMLPAYLMLIISISHYFCKTIEVLNFKTKLITLTILIGILLTNFSVLFSMGENNGFYYEIGIYKLENSIPTYLKLHNYLKSNNELSKTIFSTSPVPVAYLNLNAYPRYVDTYTPFFINRYSEKQLINELKENNAKYFLITYWAWFFKIYEEKIGKTIMLNYTLKYEVGDSIEHYLLYDLKTLNKNNYSFYISKGNLIITNFDNINLNINLNATYYELIYQNNNSYLLKYNLTDGNQSIANIKTDKNLLIYEGYSPIIIPLNNKIVIIDGNITYVDKKDIPLKNISSIVIFSKDKINITGEINGLINNSKLVIEKPEIEIKLG
ncbi:MAG: glycosyltransferase family 39 protein [Methanococci archaeon]|nr:glycosyltransferase family 39 protein [Methanococci archaeon]